MAFLDWMKRKGGVQSAGTEGQAIPKYGPDETAFRFQTPAAHLRYFMSPEEKKVTDRIEARWKEHYEMFKNHPPMSEGQEHNTKVFRAIDDLYRHLDAREHGPFKDWKRLEAEVEKAVGRVREAFTAQRRYVEREIGPDRER